VAAFGFHGIVPFFEMHITQYFFWIFVLFMLTGAGRFSVDYYLYRQESPGNSQLLAAFLLPLIVLLGLGFYWESQAVEEVPEEEAAIQSINIPGSFNNWDPAANDMQEIGENEYRLVQVFEQAGLIEFKFTLNQSWDTNFGEENQDSQGFPIQGEVEADTGGNTQNIKAYIPSPGTYEFKVNAASFAYSLDSLRQNQ
ncbi:MAG: hypothetical protein AAFP19_20670, partial [Bacteroidota bacterium]